MTEILTPMNAPRTIEGLAQIPPVTMRQLTELHLSGIRTTEEKLAWFSLNTQEAKAAYMLSLLKRWDEANGVVTSDQSPTPAAPATRVREPVTNNAYTPIVTGMGPQLTSAAGVMALPPTVAIPPSVVTVAPGAVAAAQAAAAAIGDKSKMRSPKTAGADASSDLGPAVVNLLNRIVEDQDKIIAGLADLKQHIDGRLEEASSAKSSRLEVSINELGKGNEAVAAMLQSISYRQTYTLMLLLQNFAASADISTVDLLRTVMTDSENFQNLAQLARGKA